MDFWEFIQGMVSLGFVSTIVIFIILAKRGINPIVATIAFAALGIAIIVFLKRRDRMAASNVRTRAVAITRVR